MNLPDLIVYHQLTLAAEGRSEKTQQQYLYFHQVFLDGLKALGIEPALEALSPRNVSLVANWYRERPSLRRRSRGGEVAHKALVDLVKRLGTFAEEQEIVEDNPLRKVKRVPVAKHLREPFSRADIMALWGACMHTDDPLRNEAILLLLLDTGMRIGEVCALTLDRLRLDEEYRHLMVGARGKGRRERMVPIGDPSKRDGGRTLRSLRRYLKVQPRTQRAGAAVFLARDGYPLQPTGANRLFHRLADSAGVQNAHPHRCRHTFCTSYLTQYPGDEIGLRRIVGHLSQGVLSDYVHYAQSVVAGRAAHSSLIESLPGPLQSVRAR